MRLIVAASTVFVVALAFAASSSGPSANAQQSAAGLYGRAFGQSPRWRPRTSTRPAHLPLRHLRRRTVVDRCAADARSPRDRSARRQRSASVSRSTSRPCRAQIVAALKRGEVDLNDPAVTVELLRLNAVVGVRGRVNRAGQLASIGITCALCHSTVDDSFARRHRPAARWVGQHRSECRRDRRPVARARRRHQGGIQHLGSGQIRSSTPCVRRHQHPAAEQPIAADRHTRDLWLEGRRFRDLHRRRPDLVLEQLRRRRTNGGSGLVQGPAHRPLHQAEARPRHAEAAGAARLSTEPRDACSPKGSFNRAAALRGRRLFRNEAGCASCHQGPNFTDVLSGPSHALPVLHDPERSRHRAGIRRTERHRQVPDDAAARAVAACAVLPRWQRAGPRWRSSITTTSSSG